MTGGATQLFTRIPWPHCAAPASRVAVSIVTAPGTHGILPGGATPRSRAPQGVVPRGGASG
jgi:hypothetical protein